MYSESTSGRDAAQYTEAAYTDHPLDHIEPELSAVWSSVNDALCIAVRYHARLETRPFGVVAAENGLHPETIRRAVRKLSERLGMRCPSQRSAETAERCRQAQLGHKNYFKGKAGKK